MRKIFYGKLPRCFVAMTFLVVLQSYPAMGGEPISRVDENPQYAQKPATLAYVQQITTLVKSTWAHTIDRCIARHFDVPYGKVVAHFSVDRAGKTNNLRIVSGDNGNALSQISLDAISNAQLPEMSSDAIRELDGKRVPIDVTFEYLPSLKPSHKTSSH